MPQPIPLQHGKYYHIYNRGNNQENIFVEERNYPYFLKLYAKHIEPVADTFAYCLMRNHFHLLVRIKDETDLTGLGDLSGLAEPSRAFSNLFNAYARSFNRAYLRTGALFQRPFGRIEVTSEAYFPDWSSTFIRTRRSTALSRISAIGPIRRITRFCLPSQPT